MSLLTLPVFPLPLVLFPGTPQLLHIFEPRYRQMLADCERGSRHFGLSFVQPGGARPPIGSIGCQAAIRSIEALPDGRSNILTVGADRYVLRRYVPTERLYLVAELDTFDDETLDEQVPRELAQAVRRGFAAFAATVSTLHDRDPAPPELPGDARELSFRVAAALDIPVQLKQRLLEQRSTTARLRQLRRLLEQLTAEAEQRVTVHVGARRNGKGHHANLSLDDA